MELVGLVDTDPDPEFQQDFEEILIASSSYPTIHMSRSDKRNKRPNDLLILSLKHKAPPGDLRPSKMSHLRVW